MLSFGIFLVWSKPLYAYGNILTHPALTDEAIQIDNNPAKLDDYLKIQLGLKDGLNTELEWDFPSGIKERIKRGNSEPDKTNRTVLEWLKVGSTIEDEDGRRWPVRPRHHFHDSYRNEGLDNKADHPDWWGIPTLGPFDLTGESALWWAIKGYDRKSRIPKYNENYWRSAREDFRRSLVLEDRTYRESNLASMFLNLGCVLHLLEDMGVPAHSRNDFIEAHYRGTKSPLNFKDNPLERHVEGEIENLGAIPQRWLAGWTPQPKAFSKLSDYWDVNDYNGTYIGTSPLSTWGLSEQTNYQFLSKSTIFRENDGTLYYFPHPDSARVTEHVDTEKYLWGLLSVDYRYISGYDVTHLARTKFIQKYAYLAGVPYPTETVAYHTTFDVNVYEDYANVTIPRTIDYTAGLLNYFFRGRLTIEPNCLEPDCNLMELYITNDSNNSGVPQVLKGGSFELYWDDHDGNRTKIDDFTITGWIPGSSTLDFEDEIIGTFTKPDSDSIESYTLVYKGQINANPSQPDNDDPNAIAVATIGLGYPIVAWGDDEDGIVSNIPEGNDFVDVAAGKYHALAIRSDGSLAAWGWNSYGQCDVPPGNDYVAIAGGSRHSIALKSDGSLIGWGDNSNGQIDVPAGNNYVAVASGDYHNLAITTEGLVVGWGGWNYYGECDAPDPNTGTVYVAVSAGRYHSLALQSDGTIRAWGSNEMGQTRIYMFAGNDHEAVAAADNYNFLLLSDDMLITWGGDDWLEPGIPDYHYRQPDENDFVAIAAGTLHILALTADGQILSWGWDDYDSPPYPVPEGIVFTQDIAAGYKFSLALKAR